MGWTIATNIIVLVALGIPAYETTAEEFRETLAVSIATLALLVLLVIGTVLELSRSRWSLRMNVGSYLGYTAFWIALQLFASFGLFGFDEPEHLVFFVLVVAIPSLLIVGVNLALAFGD